MNDDSWRHGAEALRDSAPRGVLFLCVANSARSQIAEGVALLLAPPAVSLFSAGSAPTTVQPEAVAVMAEIGVDIEWHRSKHVDEIPGSQIDTVITLCTEEVCPVYPGEVRKLHWALPDPAAVDAGEDRIGAFRAVRDELMDRLSVVFGET